MNHTSRLNAGKLFIEQELPTRNPQRRRARTEVPALRLSINGARDETFSLFHHDLLILSAEKTVDGSRTELQHQINLSSVRIYIEPSTFYYSAGAIHLQCRPVDEVHDKLEACTHFQGCSLVPIAGELREVMYFNLMTHAPSQNFDH